MFTGNLKNLCDKRKKMEVLDYKLSNNFIVFCIFGCIISAICIFFELSYIPMFILLGISVILLLICFVTSCIKDKTKKQIIQTVEKELTKAMKSLFCHIPNDERVFSVYCWKYDKTEFIFHIEVYSNEFTHDQIVEKIRPLQNDINYVSDITLNIYYCIWPAC